MEACEPIGPPVPVSVAVGRGKEEDSGDDDDHNNRNVDPIGNGGGQGHQDLGLTWTIAYYLLLFVGAYAFATGLWRLTESDNALASFGERWREGKGREW